MIPLLASGRRVLPALVALALLAGADRAPAQNLTGVPIPPTPAFDRSDPAVFGQQLAEHAVAWERGWKDEVWLGQMTLYDGGGDAVVRTVSWTVLEGEDQLSRVLIRFHKPAEMSGVAALIHQQPEGNDHHWLYLPADRRVRRISGANKSASFQGSEFTYEDLDRSLRVNDYRWRFLEEVAMERDGRTTPCYRVEAFPTYESTGYSRLVLWLGTEGWRTERIEYFDRARQELKVLDNSEWELVHGRFWRAQRSEMRNQQTGARTVLEVDRLFVNLSLYLGPDGQPRENLTEDAFTIRALERR